MSLPLRADRVNLVQKPYRILTFPTYGSLPATKVCGRCKQEKPASDYYVIAASGRAKYPRLFWCCITCNREEIKIRKASMRTRTQRIDALPEYVTYVDRGCAKHRAGCLTCPLTVEQCPTITGGNKRVRDNEIRRRFTKGESVASLAETYSVTPNRIRQILDLKTGINSRGRAKELEAVLPLIIEAYKLGAPVAVIAECFGVHVAYVRKHAKAHGLPPRSGNKLGGRAGLTAQQYIERLRHDNRATNPQQGVQQMR